MRLSLVESDPGFCPAAFRALGVTLDGVRIENCYTADEEKGAVWCYGSDGINGMLRGVVRIELHHDDQPPGHIN